MHCITIYQFVAAWSVCTRSVFASPFLVYQFKPNYTIFFPIACMDTRLVCSLICAHNRLAHDTIFNFVYRRRWQEWNALLVRYFSHQIAKKIDRAEAAWRENSTITKKFHLSGESQSERKRYACVKRVGTLCKTHTHTALWQRQNRDRFGSVFLRLYFLRYINFTTISMQLLDCTWARTQALLCGFNFESSRAALSWSP